MHIYMRKQTAVTDRLVNNFTNEVLGGGVLGKEVVQTMYKL